MAFSDAFARGYAIGDSMKKRKAASNFFEKFKELSANADYDEEANTEAIKLEPKEGEAPAEIAAIPLESPVAPPSTPEDPTAEVAPVDAAAAPAPAPKPEMTPAEAREAPEAPPDMAAPAGPAPDIASARQAIPLDMPKEIKITKPEEIDTRSEARKLLDKATGNEPKKKARSFTQDDLKELDALALAAGEAAGDVEVYNALKATTDSFIKSKIQRNLGLAGNAATAGDTDAVEKYMKKAYRFIPDGKELDIKRGKDGALTVQSPWEAKDRIPLTSETIAYMGMQLHDPDKFAEMMQRERHYQGQQKVAERQAAVAERGATTAEGRAAVEARMTDAQIKDMADRIGISQQELGIKGRAQALDEMNSRVSRFTNFQQGLYYENLSNQLKSAGSGGAGGKSAGDLLDESVKVGKEVDDQFTAYTTAPKSADGIIDTTWKPPADIADLSPEKRQEAGGWAQAIGVANLGNVSPGTAVKAGILLTRAMTPSADGTGTLGDVMIDPQAGVMYMPQGNAQVPIKLPANMIQALAAQQQQFIDKRTGAVAGGPGRGTVNPVLQRPTQAIPVGP